MRDTALFGLVFFGCIGFAVDFWWLNDLIESGAIESRWDIWQQLAVLYFIMLIPPYILSNNERKENAKVVVEAVGHGMFSIVRWVAVGCLIGIGVYIFNTLMM